MDTGTLDVVVAAQLLGRTLDRLTQTRLEALHPTARPRHGFIYQHLVDGPKAIGEIAERMNVTQQAVSKTVAELERLGFVERRTQDTDARVRLVSLTPAGHAVIEDFRGIRADVSERLAAELGHARAEALRHSLIDALSVLGVGPEIRDRRVQPRPDET